ncbi:peptide MFS transporter [Mobilicoccus caccae]|uniref:Transporter YclF n=1 Tax=Mobilicoccus caccae TaxID=1859295 RepID=A0ABQ6INC9_9MICO|nr:oligopeptide:H+ symporter [Mobilicoccus caccae]GMA38219.1 putative transporter YclF [Mobilicoccus caccae]
MTQPTTARHSGGSSTDRGFLGHPGGLGTLFFVELWERFSYYGMRAILVYYLYTAIADGGLGIPEENAQAVVAIYGASVYLLSVIGGFAADRMIGAYRSTLYGGMVIMAGHISLALPAEVASWTGIALVALGTGLLKPNISTMVGQLYDEDDKRRDGGFSIFYMSINIGAFFSPFIVAELRNLWGFHAGFAAAAVGMALALVLFVWGRGRLSPHSFEVPNPLTSRERTTVSVGILAALAAFVVVYFLAAMWRDSATEQVVDAISIFCLLTPVAFFTMMFRSPKVSATERSHLTAYIPLWIGAMLFWMIFEQAAGKMATFAEVNTDLSLGALEVRPEWFQSINPLAIIALAPIFAIVWTRRAGRFPSLPMKFAIGVALIGLSAFAMSAAYAAYPPDGPARAAVWVLGSIFVLQTIAELCLSPVGLSATTLLAPKAFASQAMALWFLGSAAGQALAAQIITAMAGLSDAVYYAALGGMTLAVALLLFLLVPWTQRKIEAADTGETVAAAH